MSHLLCIIAVILYLSLLHVISVNLHTRKRVEVKTKAAKTEYGARVTVSLAMYLYH